MTTTHPLDVLGSGDVTLTGTGYQKIFTKPEAREFIEATPEHCLIDKVDQLFDFKDKHSQDIVSFEKLASMSPALRKAVATIGGPAAPMMNPFLKTVAFYPNPTQAGSPRWAMSPTLRGVSSRSTHFARILQNFASAVNTAGAAIRPGHQVIETFSVSYSPLYAVGQGSLPLVVITP